MKNQIETTIIKNVYKRLEDDSAISLTIFDKDLGDGQFESYVKVENEVSGTPTPVGGRPYTLKGEIPLSSWLKLLREAEEVLNKFNLLRQ